VYFLILKLYIKFSENMCRVHRIYGFVTLSLASIFVALRELIILESRMKFNGLDER
jgi:hypothetical protein